MQRWSELEAREVAGSSTTTVRRRCRRRGGVEGLEDGTAHFLGIASLRHGFAAISRAGGFPAIEAHTCALARCAWAASRGTRERKVEGGRGLLALPLF